jgi:hypothetical protein
VDQVLPEKVIFVLEAGLHVIAQLIAKHWFWLDLGEVTFLAGLIKAHIATFFLVKIFGY